MSTDDSVTCWLEGIKLGDGADIQRLWDRYFERLVRLAGSRLPVHTRRAFDEEDVALSAFHSFCARMSRGQFPDLGDREDLWKLLATITTRKVIATVRHQTRKKRGGGVLVGESAVFNRADLTDEGLARFLSREPTPEAASEFADECDRLFGCLDRLEDPSLKAVAQRKLEGYTSVEIAAEMKTSSRTVDRKLRLIRAIWEEEVSG
jgi:DNA-directed RNA polymerase specialized sigma24 family protein